MAFFQHVQNLTINGCTLNNVSGNQSNAYNIAGPSGNPASNASTIPAITSASSVADVPLRSVNKKPPRLTTMFTGRREILQQMIRFFDGSQSPKARKMQKIFVLYGLGGGGKTSIMMKFVDEFSDLFGDVYYVDASTLATLQAGLESIARNASAGQTVDDALRWLSRQRNEWLLLLDNADDPSIDLHRFLPHCTHGNIIVTSRNKECRLYAPNSNCCVSNMEPDDAIELLLTYAMVEHTDKNRRLCANIARELGYLALAIAQAGAFISQSSGLSTYMKIYQKDRAKLLRRHLVRTADDYEWTVYTTWEMNLKQLSPTASTFLRICAFMHHDGISSKIFQDASLGEDPDGSFTDAIRFLQTFKSLEGEWSHLQFLDCIRELASFSLIDIHSSGDMYSIHPLVHSWAKDRASTEEREEAQLWAMQILALSISDDTTSEAYAYRRSLLPHVDASHVGNITTEVAERFSFVYRDCGRWNDVEELSKFVLEARQTEVGNDHPRTLKSMDYLVITYNHQKRWKEAEELGLKGLETNKRLFGDEHRDTLASKYNLAYTFRGQGQLKEAETLQMEVWEVERWVLGDEHPDTLISKSSLASLYANQGQLEKAATLQMEVLEAERRLLGDEHPDTLYSQSILGWIYRNQGRLKEARVLLSQVVETKRRLLGNNHPHTQWVVRLLSDLPNTRTAVFKYALRHPISYLRRHR